MCKAVSNPSNQNLNLAHPKNNRLPVYVEQIMSGVKAAREKALKAQEERAKERISQLRQNTYSTHINQRKAPLANSKESCSLNLRKTVPPNLKLEIRGSRELEMRVKF